MTFEYWNSEMKQVLACFDRAYVINLRERTDRRRGVVEEFARIGIDVPSDNVQFYTADRPAQQAGFPTLGARGSFTSHLAVLDLALQDGLRNVLVFEDDIRFLNIDAAQVERIAAALPQHEWDIVYFGYLAPKKVVGDLPLFPWNGPTTGGHFYGINGRTIAKMAEYMHACERRPPGHPDGGPMFRDGAYNHVRQVISDMRIFLAIPNLAGQRSSRTDLHPLKVYDRNSLLSPLMHTLRGLKNRWHTYMAPAQ